MLATWRHIAAQVDRGVHERRLRSREGYAPAPGHHEAAALFWWPLRVRGLERIKLHADLHCEDPSRDGPADTDFVATVAAVPASKGRRAPVMERLRARGHA